MAKDDKKIADTRFGITADTVGKAKLSAEAKKARDRLIARLNKKYK